MRVLTIAQLVFALSFLAGCNRDQTGETTITHDLEDQPENEIIAYPEYLAELDFDSAGIDAKRFRGNEAANKEWMGDLYSEIKVEHELMVSHGFDLHIHQVFRTEGGRKIEIYLSKEDFEELMRIPLDELRAHGRSHRVTIQFVEVQVGDETLKRGTNLIADIVRKEPIILSLLPPSS